MGGFVVVGGGGGGGGDGSVFCLFVVQPSVFS